MGDGVENVGGPVSRVVRNKHCLAIHQQRALAAGQLYDQDMGNGDILLLGCRDDRCHSDHAYRFGLEAPFMEAKHPQIARKQPGIDILVFAQAVGDGANTSHEQGGNDGAGLMPATGAD